MLQSGYKFDVKERKVYPPIPEDMYQVELFDISMEVIDDKNDAGAKQTILKFQFVVLDAGEYRGRSIWRNFVPVYLWKADNSKNALYQITKAIIQRELNESEMENFDSDYINKLIGFQCRVTTVNKNGKGKNVDAIYTNIDKFLPKKELLDGLTNEEKEKAVVKPKEAISVTHAPERTDEIPIVGLDEEEPSEAGKLLTQVHF